MRSVMLLLMPLALSGQAEKAVRIPPARVIEQLKLDVKTLTDEGRLDQPTARSLTVKLDGALTSIELSFTNGFRSQVEAFIGEVRTLVDNGTLSEDEGTQLADPARTVLEPIRASADPANAH